MRGTVRPAAISSGRPIWPRGISASNRFEIDSVIGDCYRLSLTEPLIRRRTRRLNNAQYGRPIRPFVQAVSKLPNCCAPCRMRPHPATLLTGVRGLPLAGSQLLRSPRPEEDGRIEYDGLPRHIAYTVI
jgi:hypothetical protein